MGKKILIVDDEPEIVLASTIRLTQANYKIVSAYNGKDGVKKAGEEKPDLILLDISMPEQDGFVSLEKLKQDPLTKQIPVIMLTAKSQTEDVIKATNLGAEDYVVKPFDYLVLLKKIKALIGN
ncbi:response regulator [bacterium]|nr:response regulator [bacterium]